MNPPSGLGLWIAFPGDVLRKYGAVGHSWAAVGEWLRDLGVTWVAIRGGGGGGMRDESHWNVVAAREAIADLHACGVQVFVWWYSVPSASAREVELAAAFLDDGADGLIVDAEAEWAGHATQAKAFGEAMRARLPDAYIAHAPFAWYSLHGDWPYTAFAEWCDAVHPQAYWTELAHGSYEDMAAHALADWDRMSAAGDVRAKGYAPIGCTYGHESPYAAKAPGAFSAEDLRKFLDRYAALEVVSLYSIEAGSPACWDVLRERAAALRGAETVPELPATEEG